MTALPSVLVVDDGIRSQEAPRRPVEAARAGVKKVSDPANIVRAP